MEHTLSGIALVVVLRSDAIASVADLPVLRHALERAHFAVGPVTREDIAQILCAPASAHGLALDAELVDLVLEDAGAGPTVSDSVATEALGGALPLLSQTMRTLWKRRADPHRITLADYRNVGGLANSVETAAEAAYNGLSSEGREACWPVLREMIRLDGPIPRRRTIPVHQLNDPASLEVISALRQAHLLMSDSAGITLGHDLLMTTWPRLADWLSRTSDWDSARRMLARFSALWDDAGRPANLLLTGSAPGFLDTEKLAGDPGVGKRQGVSLSHIERDFLEASGTAQEARVREAKAENDRLKTSTRRSRGLALAASMLAVCSLVLGGITALHRSRWAHRPSLSGGRPE